MNVATLVYRFSLQRRSQTTRRRSKQRRTVASVEADVKIDVSWVALNANAQAAHRR